MHKSKNLIEKIFCDVNWSYTFISISSFFRIAFLQAFDLFNRIYSMNLDIAGSISIRIRIFHWVYLYYSDKARYLILKYLFITFFLILSFYVLSNISGNILWLEPHRQISKLLFLNMLIQINCVHPQILYPSTRSMYYKFVHFKDSSSDHVFISRFCSWHWWRYRY